MRNRLFSSEQLAPNGKDELKPQVSLAIAKAASKNPFIKQFVDALFSIGKNATASIELLTPDYCANKKISQDNVGLAIERFSHRILYGVSKGDVTDVELQAFCEALAQSVDAEDVIFMRGQDTIADKNTFDFSLTVQFTQSHRMTIRRQKYRVDPQVDKSTGEEVVRNPFGWEIGIIPNEYVSKKVTSEQPLPTVDVVWPTV